MPPKRIKWLPKILEWKRSFDGLLRKESERSSKTQKATKPGNTAETLRKGNKQKNRDANKGVKAERRGKAIETKKQCPKNKKQKAKEAKKERRRKPNWEAKKQKGKNMQTRRKHKQAQKQKRNTKTHSSKKTDRKTRIQPKRNQIQKRHTLSTTTQIPRNKSFHILPVNHRWLHYDPTWAPARGHSRERNSHFPQGDPKWSCWSVSEAPELGASDVKWCPVISRKGGYQASLFYQNTMDFHSVHMSLSEVLR